MKWNWEKDRTWNWIYDRKMEIEKSRDAITKNIKEIEKSRDATTKNIKENQEHAFQDNVFKPLLEA